MSAPPNKMIFNASEALGWVSHKDAQKEWDEASYGCTKEASKKLIDALSREALIVWASPTEKPWQAREVVPADHFRQFGDFLEISLFGEIKPNRTPSRYAGATFVSACFDGGAVMREFPLVLADVFDVMRERAEEKSKGGQKPKRDLLIHDTIDHFAKQGVTVTHEDAKAAYRQLSSDVRRTRGERG